MNKQATDTAATAASTAAVAEAPKQITTFDGVQKWARTALGAQNDVDIVSMDLEQVKADGHDGKRVKIVLKGEGVENPTRRYFLRNNSAFASGVGLVGLFMFTPKKDRNEKTYTIYLGLTESIVNYAPPAAEKAAKVLLTPEQRKERRLAGKQAKRQERASAAAAAAESAETPAPAIEGAKTVEAKSEAKTDSKAKETAKA